MACRCLTSRLAGFWGVGRRAQRSRPEPHRQDNHPCCYPRHPCFPPIHLHLLHLSGSHPWSPNHSGPPPPHTITLSFHPTFRIPVLDHPNSKLWAGGQGRQAQRRRGIRFATNRMAEPQTAVGDPSPNPPPGRHPSRRAARRRYTPKRRCTSVAARPIETLSSIIPMARGRCARAT